jgi:DNA-binding CsgD family transcriptional regulator
MLTAGTAIATHTLLSTVLRRACEGVGTRLLLNHSRTGAEVVLSVAPAPPNRAPDERAGALVWLTTTAPQQSVARSCARLFHLTLAEERLLARLTLGEELRDAAAVLHMSIHTARSHLKSIFRKTGRRSQGKLLMMIGKLATIRPSESSGE